MRSPDDYPDPNVNLQDAWHEIRNGRGLVELLPGHEMNVHASALGGAALFPQRPFVPSLLRSASMSELLRIEAPHFVTGVVIEGWHVTRAAPIVKYMKGWDANHVEEYCRRKGWEIVAYSMVPDRLPGEPG